ncbi:MAG: DUF4252 domain-containing protein [Bacteroidales bacterium]|nr:DUF4252 domain-containing protein [Tenuifilaceae bacterium]
MKRIIIVLLLVAAGHITFGQAFIDDVFAKYAGKTGFTSVVITPQLFKLLTFVDDSDSDIKTLTEKLSSLRILVSEKKAIGFTDEVRRQVDNVNYINIMNVVDGKQKVDFFIQKKGQTVTDLILLAIDDSEEVLISISGNFTLNELSGLANTASFGTGANKMSLLKKLEE